MPSTGVMIDLRGRDPPPPTRLPMLQLPEGGRHAPSSTSGGESSWLTSSDSSSRKSHRKTAHQRVQTTAANGNFSGGRLRQHLTTVEKLEISTPSSSATSTTTIPPLSSEHHHQLTSQSTASDAHHRACGMSRFDARQWGDRETDRSQARAKCGDPDLDDALAVVESCSTGLDIVPPDEISDQAPRVSRRWTGDVYGETHAVECPVDFIEERLVFKDTKHIVNRPVEKVVRRSKVITHEVVEFKKVPSDQVIEVDAPYPVEIRKHKANFLDDLCRCVVAQTYKPLIHSASRSVACDIFQPQLVYVDVYIPKLVMRAIQIQSSTSKFLDVDSLSQAQWNSLVFKLNPELCKVGNLDYLPVYKNDSGQVLAYKPDQAIGKSLDTER